jgi:hypothetical protein
MRIIQLAREVRDPLQDRNVLVAFPDGEERGISYKCRGCGADEICVTTRRGARMKVPRSMVRVDHASEKRLNEILESRMDRDSKDFDREWGHYSDPGPAL